MPCSRPTRRCGEGQAPASWGLGTVHPDGQEGCGLVLQTGQEAFSQQTSVWSPRHPLSLATQRGGHLFHTTYKHWRSRWPRVASGPAPAAPAVSTSCFCLSFTLPRKGEDMGVCLPLPGHSRVLDPAHWFRMGSHVEQDWARCLRSAQRLWTRSQALSGLRQVLGLENKGHSFHLPAELTCGLSADQRDARGSGPPGQSAHLPMPAPHQPRANSSSPDFLTALSHSHPGNKSWSPGDPACALTSLPPHFLDCQPTSASRCPCKPTQSCAEGGLAQGGSGRLPGGNGARSTQDSLRPRCPHPPDTPSLWRCPGRGGAQRKRT